MFERELYLQDNLERWARGARVSQQRWMTWGSLVALGWVACVLHLPPIQRAHSVMPHVGMLILGMSIAQTVKQNYSKAAEAEQKAKELASRLYRSQTKEEVERVEQAYRTFWTKYPYTYDWSRDHT